MNYRNDNGTWRTKTLFAEMLGPAAREKHNPPYTLNEEDCVKNGKQYKSLYKLFMQCADEYEFATTYLGGPAHWKSLLKSKWFTEGRAGHYGIAAWRSDMKQRDESLAKRALIAAVREGKIQAANKLYDISKPTEETKRGRFIKDEAIKVAKAKVENDSFVDDAIKRINVVNLREA